MAKQLAPSSPTPTRPTSRSDSSTASLVRQYGAARARRLSRCSVLQRDPRCNAVQWLVRHEAAPGARKGASESLDLFEMCVRQGVQALAAAAVSCSGRLADPACLGSASPVWRPPPGRPARRHCGGAAAGSRPPRRRWARDRDDPNSQSNWCCAGVSPAASACCSLHRRKRRSRCATPADPRSRHLAVHRSTILSCHDRERGCVRSHRPRRPTKSRLPKDAPGVAGKASARTTAPVCGASTMMSRPPRPHEQPDVVDGVDSAPKNTRSPGTKSALAASLGVASYWSWATRGVRRPHA